MAQRPQNESFDTGSNYNFTDKMLPAENARSVFDLSHLSTMTVKNAGVVFPVSLVETLPGDDFSLSVNSLLRVMPQTVPMYSRQRLYVYAFWSRSSDLWNNFQVFMKRGMSGNVVKTVPCLNDDNASLLGSSNTQIKADSLGDYFGLPQSVNIDYLKQGKTDNSISVSALPFMMWLRVWRDYFVDKNEFIEDRVLFPDDDSRFRLGDDGNLLSAADEGKQVVFDVCGNYDNIVYRKDDGTEGDPWDTEDPDADDYKNLSVSLFYHDWAPDRFTTALPFAQRGDVDRATIKMSGELAYSIPALDIDSTNTHVTWNGLEFGVYQTATAFTNTSINNSLTQPPFNFRDASGEAGFIGTSSWAGFDRWISDTSKQTVTGKTTALADQTGNVTGISFNLNDLRNIMIAQTEMEKMARTDGSYAEFGMTFFNEVSKAAVDYRPTYVGGTYQNILFSEVLQTSATQSGKALGSYAGHGISGGSPDNSFIGNFHSDDFGYLLFCACIMPDTYYSQGVNKLWTRRQQTEFYLPERSKMGMQPILNYEVYLTSGAKSVADNNGLWAYNDPFDEFRSIPNRISGQIADTNSESFYPFTQSRKFSELPNWSREFSEASNVRKDYLAAPVEDAYSAQFDINIRAVRKLPYKAVPALFA